MLLVNGFWEMNMSVAKKYDLISEQRIWKRRIGFIMKYIDGEVYAMVGAHKYTIKLQVKCFEYLQIILLKALPNLCIRHES